MEIEKHKMRLEKSKSKERSASRTSSKLYLKVPDGGKAKGKKHQAAR